MSTRYPQKLAGQVRMEPSAANGVYQVTRGTDRITIIVLSEVAREVHNSFWHLFSALPENIQYGAAHYHRHTDDASTVLNHLFKNYQREGVVMPYTIEDFRRDVAKEYLSELSPQELIERLTPQQVQALRRKLSPKERVQGLSLAEMEAVVEKLQREIRQRKASERAGKRPGPGKQPQAQPNRPSSRKRKET